MKKPGLISGLILSFLFFSSALLSQNTHHWETIVFDDDIWRYCTGTSEPASNWRSIAFDDSGWMQGQGGIGYGDNDDNTIISSTISLYLRKEFNIADTSKIVQAVLNVDYDDAFVAFLNNVEIARANIGNVGDHPAYNQTSASLHEAAMYNGGAPEQYQIDGQVLKNNILPGNNVLSVQVHNENINSSDLTSRVFFSVGIIDNSTDYFTPPDWFNPPLVFTSSDLPIVNITTGGQTIPDDARIVADMGIIHNGSGVRNYLNDLPNEYNGKISIELRGSSSQMFPKKAYNFETQDIAGNNNNVALLDMPAENDWVLYAPYSDKSLLRNALTYHLGNQTGNYAPRTKFCELVINDTYQGVYLLTEKVKRDRNRIDIARLDYDDLAGDSLTGGYILKIDKTTGGSGYDWTSPILPVNADFHRIRYQFHYPDQDVILPAQANYIQNYVTDFEYALNGPDFRDDLLGYRNYIDVQSFIDFFIINELSRNVDGYRLSTFLYKEKDKDSIPGKIHVGPLWDFNLAFGNANYCNGSDANGWTIDFNYDCPEDGWFVPFWWDRLMQDTVYNNQLKCRWNELRAGCLHIDTIMNYIDNLANYLDESQQRNFQQWPVLDSYVWPNNYVGGSYENEISYLKNWIADRIAWLDSNMPGACYDLGVGENPNELILIILPNPVADILYINIKDINASEKSVTMYNSIGKAVEHISSNNCNLYIEMAKYPKGIYLIEVINEDLHRTERVIKY